VRRADRCSTRRRVIQVENYDACCRLRWLGLAACGPAAAAAATCSCCRQYYAVNPSSVNQLPVATSDRRRVSAGSGYFSRLLTDSLTTHLYSACPSVLHVCFIAPLSARFLHNRLMLESDNTASCNSSHSAPPTKIYDSSLYLLAGF